MRVSIYSIGRRPLGEHTRGHVCEKVGTHASARARARARARALSVGSSVGFSVLPRTAIRRRVPILERHAFGFEAL